MWLTLFKYKYEDFNLDFTDIRIYKEMVSRFAYNLFQDMVEWEPTLDVFEVPEQLLKYIVRYGLKNYGRALLPLFVN